MIEGILTLVVFAVLGFVVGAVVAFTYFKSRVERMATNAAVAATNHVKNKVVDHAKSKAYDALRTRFKRGSGSNPAK
jgi:uncharacterized membrane protein YciS (DUF1049 family)